MKRKNKTTGRRLSKGDERFPRAGQIRKQLCGGLLLCDLAV